MATTYSSFSLHTTPEKFYVEACDDGANEVLAIDRVSTEMTLIGMKDIPPSAVTRSICGIMGTIRLVAGMYLVVITKKRKVGDLLGHTVWRAVEFDVISYKKTVLHLTDTQMQDNKTFLAMMNNVLNTDGFYFATDYDLTHTLQRLANTSPEFQEMSLLERADQRFVWNGYLLRDFSTQPELHRFACPVIHGFIAMKSCCINGKVFDWNLISRRSCFRAGVRYYVRGIDSEGHAANFVETEQIVQYGGAKASFIQTRGSIPFFWSQRPNLKYKPKPQISKSGNHLDGFQRHFDSQIITYGRQVILNLINQKGSEKPLELAFAKMVESLGNGMIKYVAFDFHKECSRMRWHRLQILVDTVAEQQNEFGFFLVDADGTVQLQQEGTFRSNCMDCLDRTNVVQSLLARRSLQSQLQRMGVLHVGQRIEDQADFEKIYKNAWADNANACAKQYAGTGALKTDFTRTGKRTQWGLVMDGWNSMIRYYKNNFSDGFRQDSIDLFLGNYAVDEADISTTLHEAKDWKFLTLPIIMVVAFSMCIICLLMAGETWTETLARRRWTESACVESSWVPLTLHPRPHPRLHPRDFPSLVCTVTGACTERRHHRHSVTMEEAQRRRRRRRAEARRGQMGGCWQDRLVATPARCSPHYSLISEEQPRLKGCCSSAQSYTGETTSRGFILLSDRKADASFLIHHYLSFYLKAGCTVCFVGLVQSFSHYTAVAQRLGVNLLQAREKGQLVFVEALKASAAVMLNESSDEAAQLFDYLRSPVPELRALFEFVSASLSQREAEADSSSAPVLIVDDLSVLLSLGVSVRAVLDFTHYCQASICSQLQGSVVTLVRCDDEEEDEDEDESASRLLQAMSHQCTLSLRVEGLQTGYCRDIHGQVKIWWRGSGESVQSQRKIFQYKVHDKGASFFAPGTSSAVL
ncbi:hypothetical protein QTP86_023088 [Hemibagrus guttatus]|nr:hypothetical protein QTP86_023088 [Hemibagrus guttatus]